MHFEHFQSGLQCCRGTIMADLACTQCTVLKDFQCIECTVHNSAWAVAMHSVHSACQNLCRTVPLHSALCTVCGVARFKGDPEGG